MHLTYPYIIAEIANAHQGDASQLRALIVAAAESKADAVKFQWFKYDHLATVDFEWYSAYKKLFLSEEMWPKFILLAKESGLHVWADIFDDWGLALAKENIENIDGFKLPPTVLHDKTLFEFLLNTEKPLIVGVGGWYDYEIDSFMRSIPVRRIRDIILMHGFQGYPTHPEDAKLARIKYLNEQYNVTVGFADHQDAFSELAITLPIYAFFAGAQVLEKHITIGRSLKGYDYYSSLEPSEFSEMVSRIQAATMIMGDLKISDSQRSYLKSATRAVAARDIAAGKMLTDAHICFKRCPDEKAMMPQHAAETIPGIATDDIAKDMPIREEMIRKPVITIAVVCRLKSTRLTKKALRHIHGITSIERCLINCLAVSKVDHVVLATSDMPEDDELCNCNLNGEVTVVRGDPENVVLRLLKVAETTQADIIVRVTGDCPAASPEIITHLIDAHLHSGADFTTQDENHAVGTGADIYRVDVLRKLLEIANTLDFTEYLSLYFKNNPDIFYVNIVSLPAAWQYPEWRLTLDEPEDLKLFAAIYSSIGVGKRPLYFSEVVAFFEKRPEIARINESIQLKWKDDLELVARINAGTKLTKK